MCAASLRARERESGREGLGRRRGEPLFHSFHWYFIIGILVTTEILRSLSGLLNPGMINFYKAIPPLIVIYFWSGSFETCFLEGSKVTHMRSHCVMFCDHIYTRKTYLLPDYQSIFFFKTLFAVRFLTCDNRHVKYWIVFAYVEQLINEIDFYLLSSLYFCE